MKKSYSILIVLALSVMTSGLFCQTPECPNPLNLDFEHIERYCPSGWSTTKGVTIDSTQSYSGKYSILLEGADNQNTMIMSLLPNYYEGKTITLSGYIKTEQVTDGYAFLCMRLDPHIAFDNMQDRGITGTTDWHRYEISLPFDTEKTTGIFIAGGLTGKGKVWLDRLSIALDGVEIPSPPDPITHDTIEFQQGSGITLLPWNKTRIKTLKELGLLWSFLKYYHPAVKAGQYNWDYELFRVLPQVLAARNPSEKNEVFVRWIEALGTLDTPKVAHADTLPALQWITTSGFSPELVKLLQSIRNTPKLPFSYYVQFQNKISSPTFSHENAYASMQYPDEGYRLLALYRYWAAIQYFFPYREIIGERWEAVLERFIPRVIAAPDEEAYLFTMAELATCIHDSHGVLWNRRGRIWNQYYGHRQAVPKVDFIQGQAVVTGFYNDSLRRESALQIGDVITRINNTSIKSILKRRSPITEGSNYSTVLRNMARYLLRSNDSTMRLHVLRDRRTMEIPLKTYPIQVVNRSFKVTPPVDTCYQRVTPQIGYLYAELFKQSDASILWETLQKTQGVIVDLRCYTAQDLFLTLEEHLMAEPAAFVKMAVGSARHPGKFTMQTPVTFGKHNSDAYQGRVVVLVNEQTQSHWEFLAMALSQIPGAVVIGSTTAGADGNVTSLSLPGGITTLFTGMGIYYPDGGQTQRVGVRIDEVVEPTLDGIKAGRDEVLERAIEILRAIP